MLIPINQKGLSLIIAIFIILILAFMGVMFVSLIGTGSFTSVNDLQSAQALYVAEGGGEYAKNQFEKGTICGNLNYNNITLGQGTFTTTGAPFNPPIPVNLAANITAAATTIPLSADPVAAGYAPQGRIRIEDEEITYGGILGNSFINADRGVGGTTAAAHNTVDSYGVAVSALQNQCRITSTGIVGNAKRAAVVDVSGYASAGVSAFLDGSSTSVGIAETKIGSLKTLLAPGNNLIVVVVSFRNTVIGVGQYSEIAAGNLKLKRGATVLTSNQYLIRVGNNTAVATLGGSYYPQETQFLVYRENPALATACPTYDVTAQANNANTTAEVKMIVFNNVTNSSFVDGADVTLTTGAGATIATSAGIPAAGAGANVILAAVQLDNQANNNRSIAIGNLDLNKVGVGSLASNLYLINFSVANNTVNRGTGVLLMARDPGAALNQQYTVTGIASNNGAIHGQAKILVLNGLQSASLPSSSVASIAVSPAFSTLGTLNTLFPAAGDNIVIAANQYQNSSGAVQNIAAGNARILFGGVARSLSPYQIDFGSTAQSDDFAFGLIWHHTGAPLSPSYSVQSSASGNNVGGETKMMAIQLNINSIPLFGWRELYP